MEMFPFGRKRRLKKSMVKSMQKVPVFCNCRMPEMGERMIECTTCKQWFHVACVNAFSSVLDSSDAWFCSSCL